MCTLRTPLPTDAVLRTRGTRVFFEFSFASVSDPLSDPDFESFFARVFELDLGLFLMMRGDCGGCRGGLGVDGRAVAGGVQ